MKFMVAIYFGSKPDYKKCPECGGIGLIPQYCCSGYECGCMGSPVDYIPAPCGCPEPTEKQIDEWYEYGKNC